MLNPWSGWGSQPTASTTDMIVVLGEASRDKNSEN
jgi:hypothetical protein